MRGVGVPRLAFLRTDGPRWFLPPWPWHTACEVWGSLVRAVVSLCGGGPTSAAFPRETPAWSFSPGSLSFTSFLFSVCLPTLSLETQPSCPARLLSLPAGGSAAVALGHSGASSAIWLVQPTICPQRGGEMWDVEHAVVA